MTDTTSTTTPERFIPAGKDPIDDLSVRELALVSRQIGCDVTAAVASDKDGKRWDALPRLVWLWAKRQDPTAKLDPFMDWTANQLMAALGMDDEPDDDGDEEIEANPTDSAPE